MSGRPNRLQIGMDLALFAATVALAALRRWSTTDLVWGLWVSSLTVGYSLIVTSIVGALAHGGMPAPSPNDPRRAKVQPVGGVPVSGLAAVPFNAVVLFATVMVFGLGRAALVVLVLILASTALALGGLLRPRPGWAFLPDPQHGIARCVVMLPGAIFMLAFFTFHFGMFHFVHGLFLNGFFPLVTESPAGKNPGEVFGIVGACAGEALTRYWPFIGASALSGLPGFVRAWGTTDGSMMMRPYLNVIRMHIMIFVFGFLSAAGLQSYALYPLLAAYFLPVGSFLSLARAPGAATAPGAPTAPH